MNPFSKCSEVEKLGLNILLPYAGLYGTVVTMADKITQKDLGDFSVRLKDRNLTRYVECKVERKHTGNLFLETWSNRNRLTPGWMVTSQTDILWYYFLDQDVLYVLTMRNLQKWAFGHEKKRGKIYGFPEVPQSQHEQPNDTWGRLVPIEVLIEHGLYQPFKKPKQEMELWNASSSFQPTVVPHDSRENSC